VLATIHILCETDPSQVTAVVNGVIAGATMLGGGTAFGAGLAASGLAFTAANPSVRADHINRGLGAGFLFGVPWGLLMLIVFSARLVT
jgi:hypothetical protein